VPVSQIRCTTYEGFFQFKLFISLVAFFSVLFALLGVYYYFDASHQLYQEMSTRAKIQAEEIALMPDLRQQVSRKTAGDNGVYAKIAAHSDASFIVIGDAQGVHLFHSVHPEWVGTRLVGGDNQAVLEGKASPPSAKAGSGSRCAAKRPSSMTPAGCRHCLRRLPHQLSRQHHADKVINIFIAAVLLLIALFIFSWYFTRSIKTDFFAGAARNRPAGASAKGDDGVDL
jgi:two-component system cit operon sensor histidine kinase CitA